MCVLTLSDPHSPGRSLIYPRGWLPHQSTLEIALEIHRQGPQDVPASHLDAPGQLRRLSAVSSWESTQRQALVAKSEKKSVGTAAEARSHQHPISIIKV